MKSAFLGKKVRQLSMKSTIFALLTAYTFL